jgi:hypothetical protein
MMETKLGLPDKAFEYSDYQEKIKELEKNYAELEILINEEIEDSKKFESKIEELEDCLEQDDLDEKLKEKLEELIQAIRGNLSDIPGRIDNYRKHQALISSMIEKLLVLDERVKEILLKHSADKAN